MNLFICEICPHICGKKWINIWDTNYLQDRAVKENLGKIKGESMKSAEKQGKNLRRRVNSRRIVILIGEITIIILFIVLTLSVLFIIIAEIVAWCKIGRFFDLTNEWSLLRVKEEDKPYALSQDVAAICVAAASILVALITIVQAHFTRAQDRVSNFPRNYFSWVSISKSTESRIETERRFFYNVIGNTCIEFNIKEGFSSCYKANPYRMHIVLLDNSKKEQTEYQEIRINQSKCVNIHDSDVNSYEMLIDCDRCDLLDRYCGLPSKNERYILKILLDIEWINQLVPTWWRWFANLYIREEILLKGNSKNNNNGDNKSSKSLFNKKYQILYTDHYRAPFTAQIKSKEKEF